MMRTVAIASLVLACAGMADAQPTWSREVSRIMQAKCERCHRPGDIAPFSLRTYENASSRAHEIEHAVESRHMPPWKPVQGHGSFRDNFGLTDDERVTILQWIRAGAPEGDPLETPEPLPDPGEWELGDPDHIVRMPEPFFLPRGRESYRCFVIDTGLTEDKMLEAVQVKPGDRQMVHHAIVFVDSTGQAEKLDAADREPGYECFGGPGIDLSPLAVLDMVSALGGWVPGSRVQRMPEGVGLGLSKNARIVLQLHYNTRNKGGEDQTSIGLYFSRHPVERALRYIPVANTTFRIPPGDRAHVVRASMPVPFFFDAKLYQIVPHMHLLGRDIKVEVERRGGTESLIWIDDWDFHWQNFYYYTEPVPLQAGSTVRLTCTYDNSRENPRNPNDPLKEVRWGEGTSDEMCLAFLGLTFDRELFGLSSGNRK